MSFKCLEPLTIGVLIVLVVYSTTYCSRTTAFDAPETYTSTGQNAQRARFQLPKLFDFSSFKQMFSKTYGYLENLVRKKIYLAQAFRVFLSSLAYKYRKQPYYLAINHMSDWTPKELDSLDSISSINESSINRVEVRRDELVPIVADEVDIKQSLSQLMEQRKQPNLAAAVKYELNAMNPVNPKKRKRRDLSSENNLENPEGNHLEKLVEKIEDDWQNKQDEAQASDLADEVYIDWREKAPECYQPVRNQARCNSCYVFTTIALYEWHYCRATGQSRAFSEQYVVDCGHRVGLNNCNSSPFPVVADFVHWFGLRLRSHYPYVAPTIQPDQCPNGPPSNVDGSLIRAFGGQFEDVHFSKVEELLKTQPLVVIVRTSREFALYGGGVHSGSSCDPNRRHGMVLIGSGREDGEEYWLFRNSYSERWGERGHYKLNKKATHCFHCEYAAKLTPFNIQE